MGMPDALDAAETDWLPEVTLVAIIRKVSGRLADATRQ